MKAPRGRAAVMVLALAALAAACGPASADDLSISMQAAPVSTDESRPDPSYVLLDSKVLPGSGEPGERFGTAIAQIDVAGLPSHLLIGDPLRDATARNTGTVFELELDPTAKGSSDWRALAQLQPVSLTAEGRYGSAVGAAQAQGREFVVAGAPGPGTTCATTVAPNALTLRGSAYVFERAAGTTTFADAADLEPSTTAGTGTLRYGHSVAAGVISDLEVVAVAGCASGTGYVDVYERDSGGWQLSSTLSRFPVGSAQDEFGAALTISGGRLFIGEPDRGRADVYERSASGWERRATVTGSTGFGSSLAAGDDRLLVGIAGGTGAAAAAYDRDASGNWVAKTGFESLPAGTEPPALALRGDVSLVGVPDRGRIELFERQGDAWVKHPADLQPSGAARDDSPGTSVALVVGADGQSTALVGAPGDDFFGQDSGRVYAFGYSATPVAAGSWSEVGALAPQTYQSLHFGRRLAFAGETLLVRERRIDTTTSTTTSEVVDVLSGGAYTRTDVWAVGGAAQGVIGPVASGDVAVTSWGDDIVGDVDWNPAAAVSDDGWGGFPDFGGIPFTPPPTQQTAAQGVVVRESATGTWTTADSVSVDKVMRLATDGHWIVGATSTSLLAWDWAVRTLSVVARDLPSPVSSPLDVAVADDVIAECQPELLALVDGVATSPAVSTPALPSPGMDYCAVAVSGARVAFGRGTLEGGSVAVYSRSATGWQLEADLTATEPLPTDRFGSALALEGDRLLIASPGRAAAHLFRRGDEAWELVTTLTPPDVDVEDAFGARVALNGNKLVIAAPNDDDRGVDSGAVYTFSVFLAGCRDASTRYTAQGEESCAPYSCARGVCATSCSSSTDCAPGLRCDTTRRCVAMFAAPTTPSCSLRAEASGGSDGTACLLGGAALLAWRRIPRRRSRHRKPATARYIERNSKP